MGLRQGLVVLLLPLRVDQANPGLGDLVHHPLDRLTLPVVGMQGIFVQPGDLLPRSGFDHIEVIYPLGDAKKRVVVRRPVAGWNAKPFGIEVLSHVSAHVRRMSPAGKSGSPCPIRREAAPGIQAEFGNPRSPTRQVPGRGVWPCFLALLISGPKARRHTAVGARA